MRQFAPQAYAATGSVPPSYDDCAKVSKCAKGPAIRTVVDWNKANPGVILVPGLTQQQSTLRTQLLDDSVLEGAHASDYQMPVKGDDGLWYLLLVQEQPNYPVAVRLQYLQRINTLLAKMADSQKGALADMWNASTQAGMSFINEKLPGTLGTLAYNIHTTDVAHCIYVQIPCDVSTVLVTPGQDRLLAGTVSVVIHEMAHILTGISDHPPQFWTVEHSLHTLAGTWGYPN